MEIKLYRAAGGPVPDVALDKLYVTLTPHLTKICNTNLLSVQPAHQNLQIVIGRCCSSCSAAIDISVWLCKTAYCICMRCQRTTNLVRNMLSAQLWWPTNNFAQQVGPMQAISQALYTQLTSQNSAMVVQQSAYRRRKVCVHSSAPLGLKMIVLESSGVW